METNTQTTQETQTDVQQSPRVVSILKSVQKIIDEYNASNRYESDDKKTLVRKTKIREKTEPEITDLGEALSSVFDATLEIRKNQLVADSEKLRKQLVADYEHEKEYLYDSYKREYENEKTKLEREFEVQSLRVAATAKQIKHIHALLHTQIIDLLKKGILNDLDKLVQVIESNYTYHHLTPLVDKLINEHGARYSNGVLYVPQSIDDETKEMLKIYKIAVQYITT